MQPKNSIKQKQLEKRNKKEQKKLAKLKEDGRIVDGYIIPANSLAANPSKQNHKGSFSVKFYYRDITYICQGCGNKEVWTAKQQQRYFEIQKGNIFNKPKWCSECYNKNKKKYGKVGKRGDL